MGDAAGAPEGEPLAESPPVDEPVANDVVAEEPRAAGSEPEPERSEEEAGGQPQGRSNRVAPSDTGDSLTAEKSQAQSLMSGVEEKYIGQEDLDAARETILEEGQEVAGDLMGGAEGESLAGDDDYAVELRPASNQVFRAPAAGGAGGEDDGEDLFIRSTAQPEPEPAFVPHAKPAPEAEEPPAPEPPVRAPQTAWEKPHPTIPLTSSATSSTFSGFRSAPSPRHPCNAHASPHSRTPLSSPAAPSGGLLRGLRRPARAGALLGAVHRQPEHPGRRRPVRGPAPASEPHPDPEEARPDHREAVEELPRGAREAARWPALWGTAGAGCCALSLLRRPSIARLDAHSSSGACSAPV